MVLWLFPHREIDLYDFELNVSTNVDVLPWHFVQTWMFLSGLNFNNFGDPLTSRLVAFIMVNISVLWPNLQYMQQSDYLPSYDLYYFSRLFWWTSLEEKKKTSLYLFIFSPLKPWNEFIFCLRLSRSNFSSSSKQITAFTLANKITDLQLNPYLATPSTQLIPSPPPRCVFVGARLSRMSHFKGGPSPLQYCTGCK